MLLYVRMLLTMAVSLYTSRVVLNVLGIEDFGIYNVVGGIVAMFSFLNTAMAAGTQRYLTFELGKGNMKQLKKVFSTSLQIHVLIVLLVICLAETIGLWFLYNKMTIPPDRMDAAVWTYQAAVASTAVLIISAPYNAAIIAHEKMKSFAYISILEVTLKLLIVYLLLLGDFDKLKLYAVLILGVQMSIQVIYQLYCKRQFTETKYHWTYDKKLFKEMTAFVGWNLWGNCAAIAFTQGINILLNMFFGPVVNAARGISVQVQNAVNQFSFNFQTALNPQITKSYAQQDYGYMHQLIFRSSKFTFFLLLCLSLPIELETETILSIWLSNIPENSVTFLRIILCITVVDSVANPLMVSAAATGRVKRYQSVIGGILLTIVPISYIVLKMGGSPASVFIVHLCICIIAFITRLLIIRPMIKLSLRLYIRQVIVRCFIVLAMSAVIPITLKCCLKESMISFIIVCASCVICVIASVYIAGLSKSERDFINKKLQAICKS